MTEGTRDDDDEGPARPREPRRPPPPLDYEDAPVKGATERELMDYRDTVIRELNQIQLTLRTGHDKMDRIAQEVVDLKVQAAETKVDPSKFVRQEEFKPIARMVWGTATLISGAIITAVGTFIVRHMSFVAAAAAATEYFGNWMN